MEENLCTSNERYLVFTLKKKRRETQATVSRTTSILLSITRNKTKQQMISEHMQTKDKAC